MKHESYHCWDLRKRTASTPFYSFLSTTIRYIACRALIRYYKHPPTECRRRKKPWPMTRIDLQVIVVL